MFFNISYLFIIAKVTFDAMILHGCYIQFYVCWEQLNALFEWALHKTQHCLRMIAFGNFIPSQCFLRLAVISKRCLFSFLAWNLLTITSHVLALLFLKRFLFLAPFLSFEVLYKKCLHVPAVIRHWPKPNSSVACTLQSVPKVCGPS